MILLVLISDQEREQLIQLHSSTFVVKKINEEENMFNERKDNTAATNATTKYIYDNNVSGSINCFKQCYLLFIRSNQQLFRNPTLIILHYIIPLIVGICFGFVYRGIKPDISGIQNYAGSFFTVQVFWCLVSITAIGTWNSNRVQVYREVTSRSYTILPYFIAYGLNDLLIMRIMPTIFFALPFSSLSGVAYDIENFTYFCEVLILTSCSFSSICLFLGALFPSSRTGTSVGVIIVVFSLIFGGLLVNRESGKHNLYIVLQEKNTK